MSLVVATCSEHCGAWKVLRSHQLPLPGVLYTHTHTHRYMGPSSGSVHSYTQTHTCAHMGPSSPTHVRCASRCCLPGACCDRTSPRRRRRACSSSPRGRAPPSSSTPPWLPQGRWAAKAASWHTCGHDSKSWRRRRRQPSSSSCRSSRYWGAPGTGHPGSRYPHTQAPWHPSRGTQSPSRSAKAPQAAVAPSQFPLLRSARTSRWQGTEPAPVREDRDVLVRSLQSPSRCCPGVPRCHRTGCTSCHLCSLASGPIPGCHPLPAC